MVQMENEQDITGREYTGCDNDATSPAADNLNKVQEEKGISILGAIALLIGYGALVFSWLPFFCNLSIMVLFIGIPLATAGLVVSLVWRKSGIKFSMFGE